MIPKIEIDSNTPVSFEEAHSRTYKVNDDRNIIEGFCDGLEAVKQAINKVLSTERYRYAIYSWDYGIELDDLIGKSADFVSLELKSRITEALTQDDRTTDVDNFSFEKNGNKLTAAFTVHTVYGDIAATKEVKH